MDSELVVSFIIVFAFLVLFGILVIRIARG